jgi:alkaline phosphatase
VRRSLVIAVVLSLLVGAGSAVAATRLLPRSQTGNQWFEDSADAVSDARRYDPSNRRPKNVILFVGDGMGGSTSTAARILAEGEEGLLSFEELPNTALSKTYSTDFQVADSAPTATALMTGVKTDNDVINLDESAEPGVCGTGTPLMTWLMAAEEMRKSTGVVSTARITHATPAAAYAVTPNRDFEDDTVVAESVADGITSCEGFPDIARQLVEFPYGNGIDVVFGGGRQHFLPDTTADPEDAGETGARGDGRSLVDEWENRPRAQWLWNQDQFDDINIRRTGPVLGLFERSHMEYEVDRASDTAGEPSLAELTETAIRILSRNGRGFVLTVEGGRIDHAHHEGNAARALHETVELSDAVEVALEMTGRDTLIVVTADHGHAFTINGYPPRGNPILGIAGTGDDGLPYTTLSYANGPGAATDRAALAGGEAVWGDIDYLQAALVPLGSETHSGEDVPIYAGGPQSHLFRGVVEQNYVGQVIMQALGIN